MSTYKELSEYFSDTSNKRASVVKELGTNNYIVRSINDSGSVFSTTFNTEDDAEQFAEEWVK
jgi:hypothetical protein